jgi:hypothetical protein
MSTSRPPGHPQRKLVLRRKAPADRGSPTASAVEPEAGLSSTPPPHPTLLPRALRPIEHPVALGFPKPASGFDSGLGAPASRSNPEILPPVRSGVTPLPLPSRVSAPPVVASVTAGSPTRPAPRTRAGGSGRLALWALAFPGLLVAGGVLFFMRAQPRASASLTPPAPELVRPAAAPLPAIQTAPAPDSPAGRVTSVEDLPRAPAPKRLPAGAAVRSIRAASPSPAGGETGARVSGPASPESPEAVASTSAGAPPIPASSASAPVPEVEVPSVPPPPADPLIQAVQQSIDDGRGGK